MATSQPSEPNPFRDFEHTGWQNVASQYHHYFGRLTTQAIGPLLDAVGVREGVRLLDVATGPGYAAAAAARRGARVVGVDFSPALLALAREQYPTLEFREGDAEALSFPDESFDAVVMNFGMLHFSRPERAVAEAHRVLRKGGRVGFTVWAKPEEPTGFTLFLRAVETYGDPNVALPQGPPFFRFSDRDECRRVLLEAGFATPDFAQLPLIWKLPSPDALFEAIREATVRNKALLCAQSKEALEAIRKAMRDRAKTFERGGIIELPMPAFLVSAEKP